jgi:hypothetical protein
MPWLTVRLEEAYVVNGVRVRVGGVEYLRVLGLKVSCALELSNTLTQENAKVD